MILGDRMKNKGFTLIELLASIVILGILMTVAIPNVFRVMSESKADKYIDDAKKLISSAQYKMRVNSAYIKKPVTGGCIAMTLSYLDGPEFDSAPEGGQYEREYSYVIIKNNGGGKYTYIVSLVENLNAGKKDKEGKAVTSTNKAYKGITLKTEADLLKKDARKLPDNIMVNKIRTVNSYTGCSTSLNNKKNIYSLDVDAATTKPA